MVDSEPQNDQRTYFAAERTFLAWLRTGLGLRGIAFAVARFGRFPREMGASAPHTGQQTTGLSVLWCRTCIDRCNCQAECGGASIYCSSANCGRGNGLHEGCHVGNLEGCVRETWIGARHNDGIRCPLVKNSTTGTLMVRHIKIYLGTFICLSAMYRPSVFCRIRSTRFCRRCMPPDVPMSTTPGRGPNCCTAFFLIQERAGDSPNTYLMMGLSHLSAVVEAGRMWEAFFVFHICMACLSFRIPGNI